jgi:hypothetical protein
MMPSLFLSSPFLHKSYFAPCPMSDVRYPVSDAIEYQSVSSSPHPIQPASLLLCALTPKKGKKKKKPGQAQKSRQASKKRK